MKIRTLRTSEELQALASRWNGLLQRSGSNSVFLTWEWVSTWWEIFGKRFNLLLLTAEEDDGTLVGIAPSMIGRLRSASRLNFRALMLIGQQGDTMAEYLDFIVAPGREAEITGRFCHRFNGELASEWDQVFFECVLTTSPNLDVLASGFSHKRFTAVRDGHLKSPFVAFEHGNWESFLAARSRNFRNQWNNSWNRLHSEGQVEFLFGGKDLPLATALAEVARLHRERWAEESGSFRTDDYLQFHNLLCERFHANGWLLLLLLSVNGKNVAVRYDYVYGDKLWCMQGGWSPEYAAKRVGTLLTGKVIEWGMANGLREYDFLGGDSDYKRRWSTGEREMINLTASNPSTFGGWLWQCNRALEAFARRMKNHSVPASKQSQPLPEPHPSKSTPIATVSVIIPAYNYARFLPLAIDSALAQTAPPLEILVIDDGSTDNTAELVSQRYGQNPLVRYIHQANAGLSAARNTGIRNAHGEFVAFLDADDEWTPDFLKVVTEKFSALTREFAIVASRSLLITATGDPVLRKHLIEDTDGELSCSDILLKTRFSPSAAVCRRQVFAELGDFDTSLRSSEDRDMWIRVAARHRVYLCDQKLVRFRKHGNSMSTHADRMKQNTTRTLEKARQNQDVRGLSPLFWHKAKSFLHFQTAWMYFEEGRRGQALADLARSFAGWWWFGRSRDLNEPALFRLRSLKHFLTATPRAQQSPRDLLRG